MESGSPLLVEDRMEEERSSSPPLQCSPTHSEKLLEQIRQLEQSHTNLEQEMKRILEQKNRAVEALKQEELRRLDSGGSESSTSSHIRRSLSVSPPPAKLKHPAGPRRTLSEKLPGLDSLPAELGSLSIAKDRYVDILQCMGQAVYMFTTSAEVTYWNGTAEHLYGWTASEAIGRNVMELLVDHRSLEIVRPIMAKLYDGVPWVGQFPLKKKSGEIFPAMITNTPFYDNDGKLIGIIGVSSDARPFIKAASASDSPRTSPVIEWHQPPWHIPFASTISGLATKIISRLRGNLLEVGGASATGGNSSADRSTQASRGMRSGSWTERLWSWSGGGDSEEAKQSEYEKIDSSHVQNLENNVHSMSSTASMTSTASSSSSSRLGQDELDTSEYDISWDSLTLHDKIGRGSCATVYRGNWRGSDVAVKVFHELQYNESGFDDFRKEVAIMKKLRHPNIVLFLGAACSSERLSIVTELMPRGSLFKLLHRKPSGLDWKRKLTMALDVARGMTYLHNCTPPIVHRDLKSTNLLVDRNFKVKVGDFSLSRLKYSNYLTGNARMGTSQWMPPEVLRSETSNEKSDVYSFGVILWELATEEVPWKDLDPLQVIAVVGFKDQRLEIPENLEPCFADIIRDCWKSAWEERPSFEELTIRLKSMLISATKD